MTMILHAGGYPATLDEVRAAKPVEPKTRSYQPVAHGELVDLLHHAVNQDLGMKVVSEEFGLARNGAQMFCTMTLDSGAHYGMSNTAEIAKANGASHGLTIGARNSTDKTLRVGIAAGAKVFVCDNLCFNGDVMVMRKHTVNVMRDLVALLAHALECARPQFAALTEDFDRLREQRFSDDQAFSFFGRAYGHQVLGTRQLATAVRAWNEPTHPDFAGRNAWSAYNACTEALKTTHPQHALERYTSLHRLVSA